ncbi:uncharacterized protein YybS (DUF2232 family) [Paenibacillus cellulosilyticus]|uniref:Uncharacterized protein YybS (DUF2232 family) n=1 Tax=Paenibacillus cellulosilyticus TaxID=375489 RepID=A0A2V2Z164_9BACL|nr:DUF2232 domain-containing protein [Paenibacillus cellulosilyticus]PWW08814.1 uncharacterized protein YybS (DUF2232 family) [Paenibacillus cellulosilyticus]QKS48365.1 DUF2232 domain-containing protein [Paenibacillus cellulosilyticus]
MNTGKHSLLWSAVLVLLMLSMAVPFLNVISIMLMMVPYVVLYASLSRRAFAAHVAVVWALSSLLLGWLAPLLGLFFIVPAIIMGHLIVKQSPPGRVLVSGILSLLGIMLLELLLFNLIFDLSLIGEMGDQMREMTNSLQKEGLLPAEWTADLTDSLVKMVTQSVPVVIMTISFVYAAVTQYISRAVLNRLDMRIPSMPKAHDWKLPRVMVFYYLVALVLSMIIVSDDSFLSVALLNLVPLLRLAFTIQTIGFFYYIAQQRGWSKIVPLIIGVIVLMLPPLSLIGLLDTAFPIRKAFEKR